MEAAVIGENEVTRSLENGENPFEKDEQPWPINFGFDDSIFSMVNTEAEAVGELQVLGIPMVVLFF